MIRTTDEADKKLPRIKAGDVLFINGYYGLSKKYVREYLPELKACTNSDKINIIDVRTRFTELFKSRSFTYYYPWYSNGIQTIEALFAETDFWRKCNRGYIDPGPVSLPRYGGFLSRIADSDKVLIFDAPSDDPREWIDEYTEFISILIKEIEAYQSSERYYDDGTRYSNIRTNLFLSECDDDAYRAPSPADDNFNEDIEILKEEIKVRVNKLRLYGVDKTIIEALFILKPKLSRLVITEDYRILLPDYGNLEIKMEPLTKAVYLLFLHHPEGIIFKELPDYREEFSDIYTRLTNRVDPEVIERSIDKVLDPTRNTINERCSRILEAFILEMDESIIYDYTIHAGGMHKKGYNWAKSIPLDRNLVEERWK